MVDFMTHICGVIRDHGAVAVRVFPQEASVLVMFADRISNEVVCCVIVQWILFQVIVSSRFPNISSHCSAEPVKYPTKYS